METSPVFNNRFPEQEFRAYAYVIEISAWAENFYFMYTETEHDIDEEILRDAERAVEHGRSPEYHEDKREDFEDERDECEETGDPALDDVLKYKGGEPEDWEVTHRSTGEYIFNGSEMINGKTGESLTKQIESGSFDASYVAAHHETINALKSGESMIRLPDYEEEKEDGDTVLHVTHLIRNADNSITYEIRSTVISRREEEETALVEQDMERTAAHSHVEFYEQAEVEAEDRVETAPETMEHSYETTFNRSSHTETTFETPVIHEAEPTFFVEQRTEALTENSMEVAADAKEEAVKESWLSRFLGSESPPRTTEQNNSLEALPVFVGNLNDREESISEPILLDIKPEIANVADREQQIERPDSFIVSQVERITLSEQQKLVVEPRVEQKIIIEKFESVVEVKPIAVKVERQMPEAKVERRPITLKNLEIRIERPVLKVAEEKRSHEERAEDGPSVFESSKKEALRGEDILMRALGLPTAPRVNNSREIVNPEAFRSLRYSPPQNDTAPIQAIPRRTLNGISMRRAA